MVVSRAACISARSNEEQRTTQLNKVRNALLGELSSEPLSTVSSWIFSSWANDYMASSLKVNWPTPSSIPMRISLYVQWSIGEGERVGRQ